MSQGIQIFQNIAHERNTTVRQIKQPEEDSGNSIAQELRQFMAEFRDAMVTRRPDREHHSEEQEQ